MVGNSHVGARLCRQGAGQVDLTVVQGFQQGLLRVEPVIELLLRPLMQEA